MTVRFGIFHSDLNALAMFRDAASGGARSFLFLPPSRLGSGQTEGAAFRRTLRRISMGSLSIWHWIVVIAVVLLLFGRGKISELMGDVAQGIKAFKKGMTDDETAKADTHAGRPEDDQPPGRRRPRRQPRRPRSSDAQTERASSRLDLQHAASGKASALIAAARPAPAGAALEFDDPCSISVGASLSSSRSSR